MEVIKIVKRKENIIIDVAEGKKCILLKIKR